MFDYRNNLKRILQKTAGDDKSLKNGLSAIKAVIAMTGEDDNSNSSVKKTARVENSEIKTSNKELKRLLTSLTKLIESPGDKKAKENAISSIHRLTFEPGVGKNYGVELGKLDQAIQKSATTKDTINSKIFQDAMKAPEPKKRDYRKGRRYTVIRLVSGADLINDNGETVYTVTESQIHSLNLKSGDVVEALEDKSSSVNEAEILRVVGFKKLRNRDFDQIEDFKYAVVQGGPAGYSVSRNIRGEKLKIRGKAVTVFVDPSYYQGENIHLEDGAIVDLAWYTGDVRLKKNPSDAVQIRWIYQLESDKRPGNVKKKKTKSVETAEELAKLDMDLHYQRVGIAIGDNQNEAMLEGIVTRYNGIPIPINAFEGKKKVIENQIKDLDIVILVTAFAAHDSTWNIREFASKYGAKFAVSSSKGYQSFERALYRAEMGMPAYEGNQSLEYKTKS